MSGPIPGKAWWPELLGQPATPAVMVIAHERPDLAVEVLPPGSPISPGANPERVLVFIDDNGLVAYAPMIG